MSSQDILTRFLCEKLHVRGELVQLNQSFKSIVANHEYPDAVKTLLGELMAASCLLTATLKFEGEIAVQLQGDGPVSMAVINGDHQQNMRGVAQYNGDVEQGDLKSLIGKGTMVITITPAKGQRYQGVVALEKPTLAECLEHYFETSEQLSTRIWLFTDSQMQRSGGALIQVLPDTEDKAKQQDDFHHICSLTETISASELYTLEAQELLYRLYHQEEVLVFEPQPVSFRCSCSEEKCLSAIANLGTAEITEHLAVHNDIRMTCDYCLTEYVFDKEKLAPLLKPAH